MSDNFNRRNFLKKSALMSIGVGAGLSFEHIALLSRNTQEQNAQIPEGSIKGLQMGKIGKYQISRLICGGNLINGYAHSRDLIYVSSLLEHYFTDKKIFETLQLSEENGINTTIMNVASSSRVENTIRILKKYWKEVGGKIQWIAQCDSYENDVLSNAKKAVDNGAIGAFIQGECGDNYAKGGRADLIGKFVSFVKENGLIAGVGCHILEVPITIEKEGIGPDFYFKTLNDVNYYSDAPQKVIDFMKKVGKTWIAYKVLGAGVTHPRKGFEYSFKNGADFINVGMYDFQVKEDVLIAKRAVSNNSQRERIWNA